jgi:hypothetical protein
MITEKLKIADLSLDPSNVRKHDRKNLDAIKASLRKFGQQKPIVVDAKGIVIAGNGTMTAAQELGWTEIAAVRTALVGVEATAFAIADNRSAELAEWDDKLGAVLRSLQEAEINLEELGFAPVDIGQFTAAEVKAPTLKDGDRAPFRQMTFTVHDEQFEEVEAAMSKAKEEGGGESSVNENSNGNALAFISGRFNRGPS